LKKPCWSANSINELFQNPRCATATLRVSAVALLIQRAAIAAAIVVRKAMLDRMGRFLFSEAYWFTSSTPA
jgi:hypothetical protein